MYDYLLVYFMIGTAALPAPTLPWSAIPMGARDRATAVSVQERFDSESLCQRRIEAVRSVAARTNVPSEKFELACHPIPKTGTTQGRRTS